MANHIPLPLVKQLVVIPVILLARVRFCLCYCLFLKLKKIVLLQEVMLSKGMLYYKHLIGKIELRLN